MVLCQTLAANVSRTLADRTSLFWLVIAERPALASALGLVLTFSPILGLYDSLVVVYFAIMACQLIRLARPSVVPRLGR